ncbi:MAG: DEAD/DEAH box helicase [Deferrisomatales bacterium]|nr:DEAD/DEAH box helicase [Deferrisomatales bacterium]
MGGQREGVLLSVGAKQYTVLDPLYSLLEGMQAFNATPPEEMDQRFLHWADLKALLPEDAVVDNQLRSMNVVRADSFTLDLDDAGGFDPLLLSRPPVSPETMEDADRIGGSPVLPDAPQREFSRRFKASSEAKGRYVAGNNWFVVVPEPLKKALNVVRQAQALSVAERQAFVANPQAALKEALQGALDDTVLEQLFEETPTFLSDRIVCLGEWQPKLCAYKVDKRQPWLPDDEIEYRVPVGNIIVQIKAKDIPALVEKIQQAISHGQPSVEHAGQTIPATEETRESLAPLLPKRAETAEQTEVEEEKPEKIAPAVPILIDNIDDLGFVAPARRTRGEPGGIPGLLATTRLYEHQKSGLYWLQEHWAKGSLGALLADDMGLGKTLQVLAFLAWVQEQMAAGLHPRKPFLVVAPTGLLKNWEDEAQSHLSEPGLGQLFRAYGSDLRELSDLTHRQRAQRLGEADWVLTTYETLRDKIRYFIGVEWAVVAFDEAQKIKNPASRMTEMAKSVKADFILPLTGTPVENRLADLWSIGDAAVPGLLGSLKDFHTTFEKPAEDNPENSAELKARLQETTRPPFMLRRMKEDHLKGLPDKKEDVISVEMPPAQANAYSAVVAAAAEIAGKKGGMLEVIHALRKVSLLPENLGAEGMTDEVVKSSARLAALVSTLDAVREKGEKALVFLEFIQVQDALIPYLQQRYGLDEPPMRISGSVSGLVRKKRVDTFQAKPVGQFDVMLLSPKAGGVGLTITAANHVIHLSRWWNPAVEDQCTDRVFRIGQKKPVQVYYPMAIHPKYGERSFDQNLHNLLERKRRLSRTVLAPPAAGAGDLEGLFGASTSAATP